MDETIRRWVALLAFLPAAALLLAASYAAVAARYCPTPGSCGWSAWLGTSAAVVVFLAAIACIRLAEWSRHGRGGPPTAKAAAATHGATALWIVGYLIAIGAS